jgi:hypothetical protein
MGSREASVRETVDQETPQCLEIVVIACFSSQFLQYFIMYLFGDKTVFFNNVGIRRKIGVTATTEVPLLCQSKISPLIRTLIEKDQRFFSFRS